MPLWQPSAIVSEAWGRLALIVGGRDVTTFRGVETVISGWSDQEPYGSGPAQLVFPQITELDLLGTGDLSWLHATADVDIYRMAPDGTRGPAPLWSGYVKRFSVANDANDGALTAECSGAVQGSLSLIMHQPPQTYALRDIGTLMIRPMRRYGLRIGPFEQIASGIETRKRGSRSQTALDWIDELLALAMTADGTQWTLRRDPTKRRVVDLVEKDRTTVHLTVYAGGRGVALNVAQDFTEEPNRLYGEGTGPDGDRWRGLVMPNLKPETVPPYPGTPLDIGSTGDDVRVWQAEASSDGYEIGDEFAIKTGVFTEVEADAAREIQEKAGLPETGVVNLATWNATWANGVNSANLGGSRFDPLAADPRTVRWLTTGNGSLSERNPAYDWTVLPVEQLISYGEGIRKRRARKQAKRQLTRNLEGPGWFGTCTLTADPVEMHRLEIRAGMNVLVKFFAGSEDGLLFHIADVSPSITPELPVTLTIDTKARDLMSIAAMMERDRESRQDPARSFLNQRRRSTTVRDTVVGWDRESGMGVIPDRDLDAGQWNVLRVPAAQFGSIISTELELDPPCKFYAAVFGAPVSRSDLAALNPTPGTERGDSYLPWDAPGIQDRLGPSNRTGLRLSVTWGSPGQAAGYWPGEEEKGHDPTGVLFDDAAWDYISAKPPWLWLAIWPQAACAVSGRLKARVDE